MERSVIRLHESNLLDVGIETLGNLGCHGLGVRRLGIIKHKHLVRLFLRGARYDSHQSNCYTQNNFRDFHTDNIISHVTELVLKQAGVVVVAVVAAATAHDDVVN